MPDGGLSIMEAERMNRLAETAARTRRDSLVKPITEKPKAPPPAATITPPDQQPDAVEQLRKGQRLAMMKKMAEGAAEQTVFGQAKEKAQEEIRKQIKAGIRRGAEELAQGIGNAIDLGTAGISTLVTIFFYAFTLTDLNMQMIWGYYITKKKSIFFPALEWSPLPVPKIVPVQFLHAGIVLIDLLLIGLLIGLVTILLILFFWPYLVLAWGISVLSDIAKPLYEYFF